MSGQPIHVLVVDDDEMVASTTRAVLLMEYEESAILLTTSPLDAVNIMQEQHVGVLLCDLQMPEMDGIELIHAARKINPRVVCLLVTGQATKDSLIQALNDGCIWKCIEKPWQADALISAVDQAVEKYQRDTAVKQSKAVPKPKQVIIRPPAAKVKPKKKVVVKKPRAVIKPRAVKKRVVPRVRRPAVQNHHNRTVGERYRNLVQLEKGGIGIVYRAHDSLLGTEVAVKIISEPFASHRASMERLFAEARIAMQLSHKHIVRLHNIEECRGVYYLVMEYIHGCTFRDMLKEHGQLPVDMVVQIMDICQDALGYAHRREVYHRDIKPDNMMLSEDGTLKLIDFGLACLSKNRMRDTDEMVGTPYYMSPEEVSGDPLDQRADIYALGIVLHEFLTGSLPPHDGDAEELSDPMQYRPIADEDLPHAIRNVLGIAFARDPEDRWETIDDFANSFRAAVGQSTPA